MAARLEPITATLDASGAEASSWEIVVVGAGSAGSLTALRSAQAGLKTLLIDKSSFPRWKVCGGCLNLRAIDALRKAGLERMLDASGAPVVTRMRLSASGCRGTIALPRHRALSRTTLDAEVVRAAIGAGADFLPETRVRSTQSDGEHRTIIVDAAEGGRRSIAAKVVVAATGLGNHPLPGETAVTSPPEPDSWIGGGAVIPGGNHTLDTGVLIMSCGPGGYVGAVRGEDGALCLGAAFDPAFVKESGGLPQAASIIVEGSGEDGLGADVAAAEWKGTPALTRAASALHAHRLLLTGDAAGYVEPFTGEGMAWAMASGNALVDVLPLALNDFPAAARLWAQRHRRLVERRQRVCRSLRFLLHHRRAMAPVIRAADSLPPLAKIVVASMNRCQKETALT